MITLLLPGKQLRNGGEGEFQKSNYLTENSENRLLRIDSFNWLAVLFLDRF